VTTSDTTPKVGSQEQFGRQARFYSESVGHSSGESIQVVKDWVARGRYKKAADIGTGTGFTAVALAPYTESIVAADITPAMLRETRSLAERSDIANLSCVQAAAEELPFADGSLDLLACRIAAHHFLDLNKAVAEWYRVLAPESVLILADTTSPEDAPIAAWMNDVEERRDPSHILNLSPSEWLALLDTSGFETTDSTITSVPHDFDDWVRRSGTHSAVVDGLRNDMLSAPPGAVEAFDIRKDNTGIINFEWSCVVVRAIRRA
jgi:ubiquinone/menaquinone biosynthesis C-methylase UbiE